MKYYYYFWQSPLGKLFLLADEKKLKALSFIQEQGFIQKQDVDPLKLILQENSIENAIQKKNSVILNTIKELTAYFKGELTEFTIPLSPEGTDFQKSAWRVLQSIPYGKVISYGEQALRLKKPKAMRAVGQANGSNPIPIIIPCHRVIAKNKTLGGYSGGIKIKQKLLAIEKSLLPSMYGK
jgi:methylated-DNA-[protein]-cysteine S-methyltransferase